jgi:uncharacterized protein YceK
MKKLVVVFGVACTLLLSGCSKVEDTKKEEITLNKTESTSILSSSATDTSESKTMSSTQDSQLEMLWSSEKGRELNQFVIEWGKTMKQTYKEYTPENNVNLYDLQLPKRVLDDDGWQALVNDKPINIVWSDNGEGNDYALVAVFSDADTQTYLEKHVYFFTIVSGEPKVLVTMQNQGNEHNYLYFKETDNKELKEGFSDLVRGNKSHLESPVSTEKTEQVNLGTIAYKDLNTSDFIQGKAQWLGCSIEDDGVTINLIPAMSATVQNLQLYISGQGNEDYYNNFLDEAKEVSLQTGGKPVSIWSRGGDGEVIITAQNGAITFSL